MSAAPVGIAALQFRPGDDAEANLAEIARLTAEAAGRGAAVVVAPEYANVFVAPFDERILEGAETLEGPFVARLVEIAAAHDVTLVAGLVERADGSRVRNAAVAVDAAGVRAVYRKQHLYDAFGQAESDWVEPGELSEPETFEVGGLVFGLMTCYDLRFPEAARMLVDAGADVILVPAEWVRGPLKEHHWRTLVAARAIESTAYVVASDHTPPIGIGCSMVVDPQGVQLAACGTEPGVAIGWASRGEIDRVREANPALRLRRYRVVSR
ncbi:carbon-nitrogen hydrolase family protein [Microbacterium sp. gxy059]|uniref:carbon-nitrogen hydrolase family protein n=1 Tax=Microbacterium sp. gxy059 TaxID=2957199 RepID=UPI003D968F99